MVYCHKPSLPHRKVARLTQDYKRLMWILTLFLFAVGPIMEYSVFSQQEKITTASAPSSKYSNVVAKERAAMRNFKMLRVN